MKSGSTLSSTSSPTAGSPAQRTRSSTRRRSSPRLSGTTSAAYPKKKKAARTARAPSTPLKTKVSVYPPTPPSASSVASFHYKHHPFPFNGKPLNNTVCIAADFRLRPGFERFALRRQLGIVDEALAYDAALKKAEEQAFSDAKQEMSGN